MELQCSARRAAPRELRSNKTFQHSLFSPNALVLGSNSNTRRSAIKQKLNMAEEFAALFNLAGPTDFDFDIAMLAASGSSFGDIKGSDTDSGLGSSPDEQTAAVGGSPDEQRAWELGVRERAPITRRGTTSNPTAIHPIRDQATTWCPCLWFNGHPSTNAAGATHFYLALQVEWHYKMAPGTFACESGSRLTKLSTEQKEIFNCLVHMMTKQLRSYSAGGAITAHNV
jgi:hypothetical protein